MFIDMLANLKKKLEQNWKIEKLSHIIMDFKSGFFAVFAGGGVDFVFWQLRRICK